MGNASMTMNDRMIFWRIVKHLGYAFVIKEIKKRNDNGISKNRKIMVIHM